METGITEYHWKCLAQGKEPLLEVIHQWPTRKIPDTEDDVSRFLQQFESFTATLEEFLNLDEVCPPNEWHVQESYKHVLDLSFPCDIDTLCVTRKKYVDIIRLSRKIAKNRIAPCGDLRRLVQTQLTYDRKIQPLRQRMLEDGHVVDRQQLYEAILDAIPTQNVQVLAGYGFHILTEHRLLPQDLPRLISLTEEMELWYHTLKHNLRGPINKLRNQAHARIDKAANQSNQQHLFMNALYLPYSFMQQRRNA